MMGDMHRGVMALEAPLICDVDAGVHGFNPFGSSYNQQIPSLGIPCLGIPSMSWAATDPALFSIEQSSGKLPISWQGEACLQQTLQCSAGHNTALGQMEMMSADHSYTGSSVNELSQMVQLYSSLYQADHYNEFSNLAPLDPSTTSFQSEAHLHLLPSPSEVLQVVTSSGSHDSLSTTSETWRSSEASGDQCGPSYETMLANLNESASVTLAMDHSHDSSSTFQRLDILKLDHQGVALQLPSQEPWIHHTSQLQGAADAGRSNLSYDALPVPSPSDPPPPVPPTLPSLKRPRTWDEALQQGSTEADRLRYTRTSSLKLECSLSGALSRPLPRTSTRQSPFQGRLAALQSSTGAYAAARGLDLQEDGPRFFNGKPTATSVEPQSVAARHRRKKISERMRVLEKLIPGGNKMDTATMLDEAIEYVKFLQLQVQILESDSLDDIPGNGVISSSTVTSGVKRKAMDSSAGRGGEFSAALSLMRAPTTSPFVLSELLQQQLFKQKLCLVSIRQCPPRTPPTPALAPRKK